MPRKKVSTYKKTFLFYFTLVAFLAILFLGFTAYNFFSKPSSEIENSIVEITKEDPVKTYTIVAKYHVLSSKRYKNSTNIFNELVKSKVDSVINNFQQNLNSLENTQAYFSQPATLKMHTQLHQLSSKTVSLSINTTEQFSGEASSRSFIHTINYDLQNNKEISLSDIFKPGSSYLSYLTTYTKEEINSQLEKLKQAEGSEALPVSIEEKEEQFRNFLLTPTGVIIILEFSDPAYKLPEAFRIDIPYNKLKAVLKPGIYE